MDIMDTLEITSWLEKFRAAWLAKDLASIFSLFSEDVEYWETPFVRLADRTELAREWEIVRTHAIRGLDMEAIGYGERGWIVAWRYDRTDEVWAGVYRVRLDPSGRCEYFWQCGERDPGR